MVDYFKKTIDWLDDLKVEWWSFVKERFSMNNDRSIGYGHIDSGCATTLLSILFFGFILCMTLMLFVHEKEKAEYIAMIIIFAVVGLTFVGLLLVVLIEAFLKIVLKVLERNYKKH